MQDSKGPIALIIIDGWGYSPQCEGNAIALAATPYYDEIRENYPHTLLEASGTRVGLPAGVMGNSEVGHNVLGCGRIFDQGAKLVSNSIDSGEMFQGNVWKELITNVKILCMNALSQMYFIITEMTIK